MAPILVVYDPLPHPILWGSETYIGIGCAILLFLPFFFLSHAIMIVIVIMG